MARVLIVSYYFPPLGGSGALRPYHLARELGARGFDVGVLTTTPWTAARHDPDLLRRLPSSVEVLATHSWDPYHMRATRGPRAGTSARGGGGRLSRLARFAIVPSPTIGWRGPAIKAGEGWLRAHPEATIVSSHPPITSHLVGAALARRTGLPLIADYRDLWLDCPYDLPPSALHARLYRRIERRIVAASRTLVSVNEARAARLRRDHPAADVVVIPNGFDAAEVEAAEPEPLAAGTLLYVGTVVPGCEPALLAVMELLRDRPAATLLCAGTSSASIGEALARRAAELGLGDRYRTLGFVSHARVLSLMRGATALIVSGYPDSPFTYSSKTHEYLAAGRPVLGVLRSGTLPDMAAMVEASGGAHAPADDGAALARALDRVLAVPRQPWAGLPAASEPYRWDRLAERFELLL